MSARETLATLARGLATLAAIAMLAPRPAAADDLLRELQSARIVELNFPWDQASPLMGANPPYAVSMFNTHGQTKDRIPHLSFAADMTYFSGQHGAPTIDAIGHMGHDGKLFGGISPEQVDGPNGLLRLGIETYPRQKLLNRGVLLDVARHKGVAALPEGQEITAADLEATARAQGVDVRAGDSVLIRTGYGRFFESDRAKYMGLRPGPGESAARWLAEREVFLAGDDQLTFEVFPRGGTIFPAHRILIADNGIYIVENLNLEELSTVLAERRNWEFPLVLNPPRLRGLTGAPVNAFAIIR